MPKPISIKRAAQLAARITAKYDDDELTDDLLELLNGIAESPEGRDAVDFAITAAYANSPDAARAEQEYSRTLAGREKMPILFG